MNQLTTMISPKHYCNLLEHIHTPIEDIERGEKVCQTCGQVLEEKMPNFEFDKVDLTNHMNMHLGQATVISKDISTVPQSQKFSILQLMKVDNNIRSKSNRNERSRTSRIESLCHKLQLPENVRLDFLNMGFKVKKDGLSRGRSISDMDAGIAMYLCKRHGIPKSMKNITQVTGVTSRQIWYSLKVLNKAYGHQNIVREIDSFIPQFISQTNLTPIQSNEVSRILNAVKKTGGHVGKSPQVVLAAIILLVSRRSKNHNMTQHEMAKITGISTVSIRTITNRLKLAEL